MDANGGGDRLLTVREVAGLLAVSTPIVYALCERGEIRHVRVSNAIRVLPEDLEAFIGGHQVGRLASYCPPVAARGRLTYRGLAVRALRPRRLAS